MKRIRLTEGDLRNIVKESVKRILMEDKWADGTEQRRGFYVCSIGDLEDDQEDADKALEIYDWLSHNQMTVEEAIKEILEYSHNYDGYSDSDIEIIPREVRIYGETDQYILGYDIYTGAFDVWSKTEM